MEGGAWLFVCLSIAPFSYGEENESPNYAENILFSCVKYFPPIWQVKGKVVHMIN
jgi:hypothetical protein